MVVPSAVHQLLENRKTKQAAPQRKNKNIIHMAVSAGLSWTNVGPSLLFGKKKKKN